MRKIIMFNRISLDGYFASPDGGIDWFVADPEVDRTLHQAMQLDSVIFGRLTYQQFENYWPHVARDPNAPAGARQMGNELNEMTKLVFSTSLKEVTWINSKLYPGDLVAEVKKLKQGPGKDLVIFGSGSIVQQLTRAGLVDEYFILVTPVILGAGKSLFQDVEKTSFQLLEGKSFNSGNVLLHYGIRSKTE